MKFYPTLGHSIVFDHLNGIKIAFSIILNMLVTVVQATELYLKVGQWFPSGMHPHFYSPETDSCFLTVITLILLFPNPGLGVLVTLNMFYVFLIQLISSLVETP